MGVQISECATHAKAEKNVEVVLFVTKSLPAGKGHVFLGDSKGFQQFEFSRGY